MTSNKKIQIIILGDGAVGKTSLLKMYILFTVINVIGIKTKSFSTITWLLLA